MRPQTEGSTQQHDGFGAQRRVDAPGLLAFRNQRCNGVRLGLEKPRDDLGERLIAPRRHESLKRDVSKPVITRRQQIRAQGSKLLRGWHLSAADREHHPLGYHVGDYIEEEIALGGPARVDGTRG